MTKNERKQIRKAIELLASKNGWDEAMDILFPLAGYGEFKPNKDIKMIPINELL